MKHLMKWIVGSVAVLVVVGGAFAAPTTAGAAKAEAQKAGAAVAASSNQTLDHLLQGKAAPQWTERVEASCYDPRPGGCSGNRETCRNTTCHKAGFICGVFECSGCMYDVSTGWGKCSGGR